METLGIIVLVVIGFFVLRFFSRAKSMATTANAVVSTAQKFKMTVQMARQKAGDLVSPGPMTPEKQTYISYLYEIGVAMSVADNMPETMCQAFVMEEVRAISGLPEDADSKALMQRCRESESGTIGSSMGKIDGRKLADRNSSQPYFVELDGWVAHGAAS
ncbi:MAG: hypothetical protein ABI240_19300 [Sphingomonas sp.]